MLHLLPIIQSDNGKAQSIVGGNELNNLQRHLSSGLNNPDDRMRRFNHRYAIIMFKEYQNQMIYTRLY